MWKTIIVERVEAYVSIDQLRYYYTSLAKKFSHFQVPCYLPVLDEAPSKASTKTHKNSGKFTHLYNQLHTHIHTNTQTSPHAPPDLEQNGGYYL